MTPAAGLALAIVSGLCMSLNTLAYRFGQARGVEARHIGLYLSLLAGAYFAVEGAAAWRTVPAGVILVGLLCGFMQYGNLLLMAAALRRGPLSPLNCALFLGFTVVVAYSCVQFGERLSFLQSAGLVLAVASVLLGALQGTGGQGRPRAWIGYGLILVGIFLINPGVNIAIKYLAMTAADGGAPLLERYGSVLFACLYAGIALPLLAEWLRKTPRAATLARAFPFGAMAASGAILGLMALRACAALPATTVFACSALATIAAGAMVSTWWFGEPRTRPWWLMMAASFAAATAFAIDAL